MKLLLTLHVLAAIFVVGPLVGAAMTAPSALRSSNAGGLRLASRLSTIYGWGTLLVAALGMSMARGGRHASFGDPWVGISIVLTLCALALAVGGLAPALRTAAETVGSGTPPGRLAARIGAMAGGLVLIYAVIVVLMFYKP